MLQIYLKKLQIYNEQNEPIYYDGVNPNSLQIFNGLIPNNEWFDFTADVEGLDKLDLAWRLKNEGSSGKGASNVDRGSSGQMVFTNQAYKLVMGWLNEHVAAPLNGIEVMLKTENGVFRDWVIKNDGLSYFASKNICRVDLSMRQKDDVYSCIQTTLITDNHSGMFSGSYEHPRMAYCNEFRPAGLLTALFMIIGQLGFIVLFLYTIAIYPILYAVYIMVQFLNGILDTLEGLVPGDQDWEIKMEEPIKPKDVNSFFVDLLLSIAGCHREHPAPLIRDYIRNVCDKCGLNVTAKSAPIFFDDKSDYYNLTMLSADVKKGIHEDDSQSYWNADNDPILVLDMLLDKLKVIFNAEWKIRNKTLYFDRHDKDDSTEFLYDFSQGGKDNYKILEEIELTWNEHKKKAYGRFGYSKDGFDNLTGDTVARFNDIVEFNKPINPILEGEDMKVSTDFAMARFRQDGILDDYIGDALRPLLVLEVFTLWGAKIIFDPFRKRLEHKKGAVIMQNHTLMYPKLIIWDGVSKRNAKAKAWHKFGTNLPTPNPIYNTDQIPYEQSHSEDVRYDDYYEEHCKLYNYPMAFDAQFTGNLYDRFHQIEDPRINPPMNKTFKLKIPLCAPDMLKLGVYDDGDVKGLGGKIKIDAGAYYKEGKIEEINISFDDTDKLGRWIELKGKV